ncbi:metallophosphoesterase family protein [Catalinimonas niigatensis]|uniref:metallophosphoesterase family protein n=1 Tax=Catalinimonas niigatensis TaxID=1397264 RepID=UPI002666B8C5|nr:exonuclease subunit SbcD [Catalinimonas niigatensis]WPP49494.1 exonuclease subunit SbcD [Catalinimonas niigatensis]
MKLLHTADWHLGKRLGDYSRMAEQQAVLEEICEIAEREAVDAVMIAGDLFDTFNPGNEAVELFYRTLHRLADDGRRAVVAIAGNHDSPDRIEAPDPLARELGIIFHGKPSTQIRPFATRNGLKLLQSDAGFVSLQLPGSSVPLRLILTPYANEVILRHDLGTEDKEEALRNLLRAHWKHLAEQYCDDKGVNLMMAHLYFMQKGGIPPEEPDDEKPILHMGGAQAIFTEDIPSQIQYVALGHLHRYQKLEGASCPVVYSSSPLGYSFSEAHQQKYVVLIEAEPAQAVSTRQISLQKGRKLVRKTFKAKEEAIHWLLENPDTFLELTFVSDTYIESETKRAFYDAHDGIVSIIPELHLAKEQEESKRTKINLKQDIRLLFKDYFEHKKGQQPSDELMDLFNEILEVDEDED